MPAKGPLTPEQRFDLLAALLAASDFDEALRMADLGRGAALAERARDALFALEWDRMTDTRMAELQARLLDKAIAGLTPGIARPSEASEKYHIALAQWLADRAATRHAIAPAPTSTRPPSPASDHAAEAAELDALIARAEARLVEAEAALAADGRLPNAD